MKTLPILLASATAAAAIWGTGAAIAQSERGASAAVVEAQFRGHRRGGKRAMMQILQQADGNDDNALTQAELDAFVAAQVAKADADSNGDITLAEFETIWADLTKRRAARAFQRLDRDASGTITAEERDQTFGGIVDRFDRNDDGKLDRADMRGRGDRKGRRGSRG